MNTSAGRARNCRRHCPHCESSLGESGWVVVGLVVGCRPFRNSFKELPATNFRDPPGVHSPEVRRQSHRSRAVEVRRQLASETKVDVAPGDRRSTTGSGRGSMATPHRGFLLHAARKNPTTPGKRPMKGILQGHKGENRAGATRQRRVTTLERKRLAQPVAAERTSAARLQTGKSEVWRGKARIATSRRERQSVVPTALPEKSLRASLRTGGKRSRGVICNIVRVASCRSLTGEGAPKTEPLSGRAISQGSLEPNGYFAPRHCTRPKILSNSLRKFACRPVVI